MKTTLRLLPVLIGLIAALAAPAAAQSAAEIIDGRPAAPSPVMAAPANLSYWRSHDARIIELCEALLVDPTRTPTPAEVKLMDVYYNVLRTYLQATPEARSWYVRVGDGARLLRWVATPEDYEAAKSAGWSVSGVALSTASRAALALKFGDYATFEAVPRDQVDFPVAPSHYGRWLQQALAGMDLGAQYAFLVAESQAWELNTSTAAGVAQIKDLVRRRMDTTYVLLRRQQQLTPAQ